MAQLAARVAHNHKVGDSSSPPATKKIARLKRQSHNAKQ